MSEDLLGKVSDDSGVAPEDVRSVVTAYLKAIHLVAATDGTVTTAAIMQTLWNFGLEASFHLGGLLTYHDDKSNDLSIPSDSDVPELMTRLIGDWDDLPGIVQEWRTTLVKTKSN